MEGQGELSFQGRLFEDDKNSTTIDDGQALFGRADLLYESGRWGVNLGGFGLYDYRDDDRNRLAPEDLWVSRRFGDTWLLKAGYQIFNWTTLEAFHPADTINSRSFDSNLELFSKNR